MGWGFDVVRGREIIEMLESNWLWGWGWCAGEAPVLCNIT